MKHIHHQLGILELERRVAPVTLTNGETFQFTDADGDVIKVEFSGAGSATILDAIGHTPHQSDIAQITLWGSDYTTALVIYDLNPLSGSNTVRGGTISTGAGQDVGMVSIGVTRLGTTAGMGTFSAVNVGGSLGALVISGDYDADHGAQTICVGRSLGLLSVRNLILNSTAGHAGIYKADSAGDVSFIQIQGNIYDATGGAPRAPIAIANKKSVSFVDDSGGKITVIARGEAVNVLTVPMPGGGVVISRIEAVCGAPSLLISTRGMGADVTEIRADAGSMGDVTIRGARDTDVFQVWAKGRINRITNSSPYGDIYDIFTEGTIDNLSIAATGRLGAVYVGTASVPAFPNFFTGHGLHAPQVAKISVGGVVDAEVATVAQSIMMLGPVKNSQLALQGNLDKLTLLAGLHSGKISVDGYLKSGTLRGGLSAGAGIEVMGSIGTLNLYGGLAEGASIQADCMTRVTLQGEMAGLLDITAGKPFVGSITVFNLGPSGLIHLASSLAYGASLTVSRNLAGTIQVDGDVAGRIAVGQKILDSGYITVGGQVLGSARVSAGRGNLGFIVADTIAPHTVRVGVSTTGVVQRSVPYFTFSTEGWETYFGYEFRGVMRTMDVFLSPGATASLYLLDPLKGLVDITVKGGLRYLTSDHFNFRNILAGVNNTADIYISHGDVTGLLTVGPIGTAGSIVIGGDLASLYVSGDMGGSLIVDGDLLGTLQITGRMKGIVEIQGNVGDAGEIRVDSDMCGDLSIGGHFLGSISLGGLSGALAIQGDVSNIRSENSIHIRGDVSTSGSIHIAGAQVAGTGQGVNRIRVDGTFGGMLSAHQFGDVVLSGEWAGSLSATSPGMMNTLWYTYRSTGVLTFDEAFYRLVPTGHQIYLTPGHGEATFTDKDGDQVRLRYQGGAGSSVTATLAGDLTSGEIVALVFQGATETTSLEVSVAQPLGNGWAKVGRIEATGQPLGSVTVQGSISSITAAALVASGLVRTWAADPVNANQGDITLSGDLAGTIDIGGSLTGTLSVSGDMSGDLFIGQNLGSVFVYGPQGISGAIQVGGDLTGLVVAIPGAITHKVQIGGSLAEEAGVITGGALAGICIAGSVGMTGVINVGDILSDVFITGPVTGSITAYSIAGEFKVGGDFSGMLLTTQDMNCDFFIRGSGGLSGVVIIGRDLAGVLTSEKGGISGVVEIGRDITSSGAITTGGGADGTITIGGNLRGSGGITIGGNLDGLLQIVGVVKECSGVTVMGNLNTTGAIHVGGITSTRAAGAIFVAGDLYSIQPASILIGTGGIATGSSVLVGGTAHTGSAIQVDGEFHGLIWVGTSGGGVFGRVVILNDLSEGTLKAFAANESATLVANYPDTLTYECVQGATSGHEYAILFGQHELVG